MFCSKKICIHIHHIYDTSKKMKGKLFPTIIVNCYWKVDRDYDENCMKFIQGGEVVFSIT